MRPVAKGLLWTIVIVILVAIATLFLSKINFEYIRQVLENAGILAPVVYILFMAVAIIVSPIPSLPLTIMAGVLFGGFMGGTYSIIGAELGALIAWWIGKKYGVKIIKKMFKHCITIPKRYRGTYFFGFIFVSRLLPIFQFDLVSYTAGILRMRFWPFALATLLGMLPVTYLFSYSGTYFVFGNVYLNVILTLLLILLMVQLPRWLHKKGMIELS